MATQPGLFDPRLAKALSHPMRIRILTEQVASPNEIAEMIVGEYGPAARRDRALLPRPDSSPLQRSRLEAVAASRAASMTVRRRPTLTKALTPTNLLGALSHPSH